MSRALLLPAALLLLGCQPDAQLSRLQNQVQAQQDTLRQLRRQLSLQQDSLGQTTQRLGATQQQLEETALMANAIEQSPAGAAPRAKPRPGAIPPGTLYGKPAVVKLPDLEMAEVLSMADSSSGEDAENFGARAYLVCNGPSDATLDECNCSHFVYLTLSTGDLPYEYKLFRLGPFFEAGFAGWEKGPQDENHFTLRIRHDVKGRKKTDSFRISWQGVRQL